MILLKLAWIYYKTFETKSQTQIESNVSAKQPTEKLQKRCLPTIHFYSSCFKKKEDKKNRNLYLDLLLTYMSIQLTYGLQDMGLVEILCSKGHHLANKDGIFCTDTLIY